MSVCVYIYIAIEVGADMCCMYMLFVCCICVFPTSVQWEGLEAIISWELWPHLASKSLFLKPPPTKRSQGSWEKLLIPGLGQGKHKSLESPLGPESKEELRKLWRHVRRAQEAAWGDSQWLNLDNLSIQRNKEVVNYNPLNIIGIYESIQIMRRWMNKWMNG